MHNVHTQNSKADQHLFLARQDTDTVTVTVIDIDAVLNT